MIASSASGHSSPVSEGISIHNCLVVLSSKDKMAISTILEVISSALTADLLATRTPCLNDTRIIVVLGNTGSVGLGENFALTVDESEFGGFEFAIGSNIKFKVIIFMNSLNSI